MSPHSALSLAHSLAQIALTGAVGVNWHGAACLPYSPIIDGCKTCVCGPDNNPNTRPNAPYMGILAFVTAVGAGGQIWRVRGKALLVTRVAQGCVRASAINSQALVLRSGSCVCNFAPFRATRGIAFLCLSRRACLLLHGTKGQA